MNKKENILNKETLKLRNKFRKLDVQKRLDQLRNFYGKKLLAAAAAAVEESPEHESPESESHDAKKVPAYFAQSYQEI